MTPLSKVAAIAASLVALVSLTACGATPPSDAPSAGASDSATASTTPSTTSTATAAAATTTPAPVAGANIDDTLCFLGVGAAGGIYYLHNNALTLAISDASFGFFQSATMSPDGKRLAWILADSAGGTGQLRVQTYGAGSVTIGPTTISNAYTPQWSADSTSVIVAYGASGWVASM